ARVHARAPPRPTDTSRPGCPCAATGTARFRVRDGWAPLGRLPLQGSLNRLGSSALMNRQGDGLSHNREPVTAPDAPEAIGPYVHAVRAGDLLFCSGQIPLDPRTGETVGNTPADQAGRCLENLAAVCQAAGASLGDAVK